MYIYTHISTESWLPVNNNLNFQMLYDKKRAAETSNSIEKNKSNKKRSKKGTKEGKYEILETHKNVQL
jgi:hypothetical protein